MAGILIAAVCIFGKRLRLRKSVAGMEKVSLDNMQVRITDMNVTPFTVGLLKPKIVIPKVVWGSYGVPSVPERSSFRVFSSTIPYS